MKQRRIPIRTCIACRATGSKRDLIRVVRMPAGDTIIDPTGKVSGRGAYICPSPTCIQRALKEKRLARALRSETSPDLVNQLESITQEVLLKE